MGAFRVLALLAVRGCCLQAGHQFAFGDRFNVGPHTQSTCPERWSIKLLKCLAVSIEPRFHRLNHEVELLIEGAVRALPLVTLPLADMLPWVHSEDRTFPIDRQNRRGRPVVLSIESLVAITAAFPSKALQSPAVSSEVAAAP